MERRPLEEEGEAEEYVCRICGRRFESKAALERHVHDAGLLY